MAITEHRNAWNALLALYRWFAKTVERSGAAHVAQRLKDFAADCRLSAINKKPVGRCRFMRFLRGPLKGLQKALSSGDRSQEQRDMVTQLSYLGRALPKGRTDKEGKQALVNHIEALGSQASPLPEGRREELAKFAEEWANQHLEDFAPHLEFEPSAGACLEYGRKSGGLGRYLHEKMTEVVGEAPKYVKKLTTYPVAEDDMALRAHATLAAKLATDLPGEYPKAQAVVVCERGMKVRVVTKSPGALVAILHLFRRWCASGLRRDPSIKMVLAGDHEKAVEEMFGSGIGPQDIVVSSDLKSATDLISRETYEALWEGISRSNPGKTLPKFVCRAVSLAVGPQVIEYPALGRFTKTKRGALMGLPSTWFFLCLANLAWWNLAHQQEGRRLPSPRPGLTARSGRVRRVTICGDDLVGASSSTIVVRYEVNAIESGAKFSSAMKHIKSRTGGVFTENVFFMEDKPRSRSWTVPRPATLGRSAARRTVEVQRTSFSRWSQAFPIRGILGTMRSDRTGREDPYWISLGPAMEQMMARRDQRWRKSMIIALRAAHPDLEHFLREHGLKHLFHVPRVFGGLGIPRAESLWNFVSHGESFHLRAALALSAGSGWDSDLTILSRPYTQSPNTSLPIRRVASQMSEVALRGRWSVIKTNASPPPGYYEYPGHVQDLVAKLEGNCARDMFFLAEPQEQAERPTKQAGRTARRLRRDLHAALTRVVTTQGGWTCGKAVTLNWRDALERLQAIETSRKAVYNPALVPKRWLLSYPDQQRLVEMETQKKVEAASRRAAHLATLTSKAQKKQHGRVPLLESQILQISHDLEIENKSLLVDRPSISELPVREWADRQTKRFLGEAMGWFHH